MPELPHHCEKCGDLPQRHGPAVGGPGDDASVYLSPRCHEGSSVFCLLTGDVLSIECATCRRVVGRLRVVSEPLTEEEAVKPEEQR